MISSLLSCEICRNSTVLVTQTVRLFFCSIFGLLCQGCASGPKYAYTAQRDSAVVSVAPSDNARVFLEHIDGFAAPIRMQFGLSSGTYLFYLSPGLHKIELSLDSTSTVTNGIHSFEFTAGGGGTIEYNFMANGNYHMTAYYGTTTFYVTPWDDTTGSAVKVGNWSFGR